MGEPPPSSRRDTRRPISRSSVGLGETDPTHMFIDLSQAYAAEGTVTFVVTNEGTETHEFVVLRTDSPADSFPIVSFEGEPNRIDEDASGVTNVGETGDMEPGTTMALSLDLAPGHYAVVCNLAGHYAMGMHQDFNVVPAGSTPIQVGLGETDPTHMFIDLSQAYAPEGEVTFIITNQGAEDARVRGPCHRHPRRGLPDHRVRGRAQPVRRGRQGPDQRGGDGRPGDGAGHLADAHDRHVGRPLRRGLQPGRALRDGDAPGLQRGAGRLDADPGRPGRDRPHPHVHRPVPGLRPRG